MNRTRKKATSRYSHSWNRALPGAIVGLLFFLCSHAAGQQYQTLGPVGCGIGNTACHARENKWYVNDAHKKTLTKLEDADPVDVGRYLLAMKMTDDDLLKRDNMCMACHGTSVSAQKNVEEGVSCESCHGPGSGYKDAHQEGKGGGANRLGYVNGVSFGMRDFRRDKSQVATTCVRCHYITDDRLLTAEHSDGTRFNYVSKLKDISGYPNHWERAPGGPEDPTKDLFDSAKKAKKGSKSSVVVQSPAPKDESQGQGNRALIQTPTLKSPQPPRVRPVDPAPIPVALGPVDLPPFPVITDNTRLDSLLLILKQRLELLHLKTRGQ